jgi:hypothetical protein
MTKLRLIPQARLKKLLDSDELYEMEFDDCPVTIDDRRALRCNMPWTVFTAIARLASDTSLNGQIIVQQLDELAGFVPLRDVLERHFFKRAKFLRCYRVLNDARKILSTVRFRHLPEFRKKDREDKEKRDRFLGFIRTARGDSAIAKELEDFVSIQFGSACRADRAEAVVRELDRNLGQLFHDMEEYNADFDALGQLEKGSSYFSAVELSELRPLLGLYGVEPDKRLPPGRATIEHAAERQQAWCEVSISAINAGQR